MYVCICMNIYMYVCVCVCVCMHACMHQEILHDSVIMLADLSGKQKVVFFACHRTFLDREILL